MSAAFSGRAELQCGVPGARSVAAISSQVSLGKAIVRSDFLGSGRLNPHSHLPELPFRHSSARRFSHPYKAGTDKDQGSRLGNPCFAPTLIARNRRQRLEGSSFVSESSFDAIITFRKSQIQERSAKKANAG